MLIFGVFTLIIYYISLVGFVSSEIMVVFLGLPMRQEIPDKCDNTQDKLKSTQDEVLTDKEERILA